MYIITSLCNVFVCGGVDFCGALIERIDNVFPFFVDFQQSVLSVLWNKRFVICLYL